MRKNLLIAIFITSIIVLSFAINSWNKAHFCANSISCIKDLTGIYDNNKTIAQFGGKTLFVPNQLAEIPSVSNVLGEFSANKRIEVDLANQRLYAYEGGRKVFDFLVSTGKWGRTPTGEFNIWIKMPYTKMEGGNKALGTYYNLPNVPYTMFFYNDKIPKWQGFGIHGAYWHNNFGHPMSHGCINMKIEEAEKLYYWANPPSTKYTTYANSDNPGTKIVIYGQAPNE